jgi:hypothetical protein
VGGSTPPTPLSRARAVSCLLQSLELLLEGRGRRSWVRAPRRVNNQVSGGLVKAWRRRARKDGDAGGEGGYGLRGVSPVWSDAEGR